MKKIVRLFVLATMLFGSYASFAEGGPRPMCRPDDPKCPTVD
jgi:hypothetical protein